MRQAALAGRKVLELADEKGVYCGKLLADMGADVIKIERPGGDATRDIAPFWRDERDRERSLFFLVRDGDGAVSWAFPVTAARTPHHLVPRW